MEETFKVVEKNREYQIGDNGTIISSKWGKTRILVPVDNHGYLRVKLTRPKEKQLHTFVHRLVAEAFIPNPNNYPFVNHLDGNPHNNHVSNLEWCTKAMNNEHAWRTGLQRGHQGNNKRIECLDTGEIFPSARHAAAAIKGDWSTICRAARGGYKTSYGYRWRYLD